jgi:hypothetical protein
MLSILVRSAPTSGPVIPEEIRAGLSTVNETEIRFTGRELPKRVARPGFFIGPVPKEVRKLAAYSRRLGLYDGTGDDKKIREMERLAWDICLEDPFLNLRERLNLHHKGSLAMLYGWQTFFFPEAYRPRP